MERVEQVANVTEPPAPSSPTPPAHPHPETTRLLIVHALVLLSASVLVFHRQVFALTLKFAWSVMHVATATATGALKHSGTAFNIAIALIRVVLTAISQVCLRREK